MKDDPRSARERALAEIIECLTPKEGFRIAIPSEVGLAMWGAAIDAAANKLKLRGYSYLADDVLALKGDRNVEQSGRINK